MARPYRRLLRLPDGRHVTRPALAKELGIAVSTLHSWLERYTLADILTRQPRGYRVPYQLPDGRTVTRPEVAKELGVAPTTMYTRQAQGVAQWLTAPRRGAKALPPAEGRSPGREVADLGMAPEHTLVAALLRVAVHDARSRAQAMSSDAPRRAEAQAWLRNREAVMYWLELANLPEETYDALLKEAGLEETTP